MDVDKIINDFQQKKDELFPKKVESFVEKIERINEKIINYNSEYDLKIDTKKLAENVEVYIYHCALYVKNYDQLSDVDQASVYNDLKETLNFFVEYYNSIADAVNKIINERNAKKEYDEKMDEYGSKAAGYLVFGFLFLVVGILMFIPSVVNGNSLLGLTVTGGIVAILGIIFIIAGTSYRSKAAELDRRRYLESLDEKQFRIEQQIMNEKNDEANTALLGLIALGIWNK